MHNEYDQDEFPRIQPPRAGMPNKASLKRSLIPAESPLVLAPDLHVTFPDKARLKRIPTATAGKVVPMGAQSMRRAWATGAVAAAVAGLVWFALPENSISPPPAAPARMATIPADGEALIRPIAPSMRTSTPAATFARLQIDAPTVADEKDSQSARPVSPSLQPLEAKLIANIPEPFAPAGELQWRSTSAAENMPPLFAAVSAPLAHNRLQSAQEALATFVADQPIGGAIARVKNLRDNLQAARSDIPAQARDLRLQAQERTRQWRDAIRKKREAVQESLDESLQRWESKDWKSRTWRNKP